MAKPTSDRKPSRLRLWAGLLCAFLPTAASKALIIPGAMTLVMGWYQWARADSAASAIACWMLGLTLLAESFNYEGGWRRGELAPTRALAAIVFFVARIGAILFFGLTAIVAMFYGQWLIAALLLGFFTLTFFDFAQRIRQQALDDEREEGERLRAFINPEQFIRRHQPPDRQD